MRNPVPKIGVREFRTHLLHYLLASLPVAITRHGETVGFYIPAHQHQPQKTEIDALKRAAQQLENLLASHGVTEDELVSEFRALKQKERGKR